MALSLFITIFAFSTLLILFLFLQSPTFPTTFTLLDDAHSTKSPAAISLTRELSGSVGRAFLTYPTRFLAPNSSASFSCTFSFTTSPTGDGLAFLITPNATSSSGQTGLPGVRQSFLAVEFIASLDAIALDINGEVAEATTVSLKSGKKMRSWVEYQDEEKTIKIWVSHSFFKPPNPVISTRIDLSRRISKEFMHVGFSASNGPWGSARHVVENFEFTTFGRRGGRLYDVLESDYVDYLQILEGLAALCMLVAAVISVRYCYLRRLKGKVSLDTLYKVTNRFNRVKIFGKVPHGTVFEARAIDGTRVAIKRFNRMKRVGDFDKLAPERAATVSKLRHPNLIQLRAWCFEEYQLILVYEHVDGRASLHTAVEKSAELNWERRVNILIQIASALAYLHERGLVHADLHTRSTMLDRRGSPKLGDFGFMQLFEPFVSHTAFVSRTGRAYLAPEYVNAHEATAKSDVYSFGVVILEVATGRRPVDPELPLLLRRPGDPEMVTVVNKVRKMRDDGRLLAAADARLRGSYDRDAMEQVLMVGLSCVHQEPTARPTMIEVESMLRGEIPVHPFGEAPQTQSHAQ